jgi:hypothetical protein
MPPPDIGGLSDDHHQNQHGDQEAVIVNTVYPGIVNEDKQSQKETNLEKHIVLHIIVAGSRHRPDVNHKPARQKVSQDRCSSQTRSSITKERKYDKKQKGGKIVSQLESVDCIIM